MSESNGPYLSYAVLCEKVLREPDDVMSFIRIVDHVTVTVAEPASTDASPAVIPPTPLVALTFVVGLKSGGYVGSVPVKIRIEPPVGPFWPTFDTTAQLDGVGQGVALVIPVQLPAHDEGVYWFAVEVSGALVTRIPLRITRQTVTQAVPPQQD